ncbi:unnamed protein product [Candida verbasci]|uniref:Phosducin domain-containing protein n=1 Tax=Candida verbasci TaxID=1227364 RepID=A0A9W4TXQ6_9ASCO|nr:unnamed protein product [Candida verbasci]
MDPKIQVQVDPNEDTEWNDILRSHGIIPEKPPSPTQQIEEALDEAIVKQYDNRLENKTIDELDELEDEEDEDFLNFYKQKRLNELKQLTESKKFGDIFPINKSEYEQEVTQASNDSYVVIHLTLQSNLQSRLLSSLLQQLSKKFPEIKFCEIPAQRCIENYPESNCPTLIIYHKTQVLKQYITLTQLGGNSTSLQDIERVLVDVAAIKDNDKRLIINNEDEEEFESRKLRFAKKSIRTTNESNNDSEDNDDNNDNDDDDDDFYD